MKKQTSLHGRAIASLLPKEHGFQDVSVVFARSLIEGQYTQGSGKRKGEA